METVTLYRPVGAAELRLIVASDWRTFPPRLPEQPIFYPVVHENYAIQIARDWNTKEPEGVGYVTAFDVASDFLKPFHAREVGGREHLEYWIPAADLAALNSHIVGRIRLIHEFRASRSE